MFRNIRERREAFRAATNDLRGKIDEAAQRFEPARLIVLQVN